MITIGTQSIWIKFSMYIRYFNNWIHPSNNHQYLNETIVSYELYLRTAMFQNLTKP